MMIKRIPEKNCLGNCTCRSSATQHCDPRTTESGVEPGFSSRDFRYSTIENLFSFNNLDVRATLRATRPILRPSDTAHLWEIQLKLEQSSVWTSTIKLIELGDFEYETLEENKPLKFQISTTRPTP